MGRVGGGAMGEVDRAILLLTGPWLVDMLPVLAYGN